MSIQTVSKTGTKRGGIALLLALVAVAAGMALWFNNASAQLPNTTASFDQTPNGATSVAPGDQVNYIVNVDVTANFPVAGDRLVIGVTLDSDTVVESITCSSPANGGAEDAVDNVGPYVACAWNGPILADLAISMNIQTHVLADTVSAPTGEVCASTDADLDCTDESANEREAIAAGDTGTITVDASFLTSVDPEFATNALGVAETFVFSLDDLVTCASDDDGDVDVECTAADVNLDGATLLSGPTTVSGDVANGSTVSVTVLSNGAQVSAISLDLQVLAVNGDPDATTDYVSVTDFTSVEGTKTWVQAELRHIDADGDVIDQQDVLNNARGIRHTVCAVEDINDTGVTFPLTLPNTQITVHSGGGATGIGDPDPTFTDPIIFTQMVNGSLSTCFSWVSTEAGDQEVSVTYVGSDGVTSFLVDWDTDASEGNENNTAIIKEWNVLDDSELFINGVSQGTNQNVVKSQGIILDPSTGDYIFPNDNPILVQDVFHGSHYTRTGTKLSTRDILNNTNLVDQGEEPDVPVLDKDVNGLVGIAWEIALDDDSCEADLDFTTSDPYGGTGDEGTTELEEDNPDHPIAVNYPSVEVDPGDCLPGQSIILVFTGEEVGPLGSGPGRTVTETVTINLTAPVAAKQVFLAWAGQRVVLEHDWRIDPGDDSDLDPAGFCPFNRETDQNDTEIVYVKGSGPGNFVAGLDANDEDAYNDAVSVDIYGDDQSDTVPGEPQGACISRVIYESEDPGQVDIEAFLSDGDDLTFDVSKIAFVIYYMKFNTVDLSLVTQVSKPTHNGSVHGYGSVSTADYNPGNPWDATADDEDGAAEWNVSKDILVRGRVSGWFVNENPSGRAADATDPYNVLPANRWIMPIDWPMLAGGPRDPEDGSDARGTAEEFRPYYNLLFAPNNAQGIALTTPSGATSAQVAIVTAIAGITNSSTTFGVSTFEGLYAGATVTVGTVANVGVTTLNANGTITVTGLVAAPAAGTPIFIATGVPFEGPYSLIDIPGLAATNGGIAGAALSNLAGDENSATRDTILADNDIDMWDAPMPPAMVSVKIRGAGFIKQVLKEDVYYIGTANTSTQIFPNPFYITNIPDSPFIPAVAAGGGYLWNSWGNDGPAALGGDASSVDDGLSGDGIYRFWEPVVIGSNSEGVMDSLVSNPASTKAIELGLIRTAYNDWTIARDLVVYSDNHGEFMVTANGDFNLTYDECATNTLGGGKLCAPGDKVGVATITSTADYPDFRGKHFPVASNAVTVDWIWGGYKDVTIEAGEDPQISYVVFHAIDRDGFCNVPTGAISLHSVLTSYDTNSVVGSSAALGNQIETVDFLIDSDEGGIILNTSSGATPISVTKEFASGVATFSTAVNAVIKEFPNSDLAASETADECQAWIRISNSLLKVTNVLVVAHNDPPEGNVTFDRIVDFSDTATLTLNFRWSLVTWTGANNIPVEDALKGTGLNEGGSDIFDQVTAVYGWDAAAQDWLGYFPAGVGVPGANDLTALQMGQAYWIAIKGPGSVTWTIETNVDQ